MTRDRTKCYQELKKVRLTFDKETKIQRYTRNDASLSSNVGKKDIFTKANNFTAEISQYI